MPGRRRRWLPRQSPPPSTAPALQRPPAGGPIQRRGQVYRDVVREEINVKYIRHRHAHDLPPNQRGLSLFGPGELVDGEVDLKAQVSDARTIPLWEREKGSKVPGKKATLPQSSNWKGPL